MESLEHGESVDVICTDFSKAYDKCETNYKEVGVGGRVPGLVPVVSGMPQGTVLGPGRKILKSMPIRPASS